MVTLSHAYRNERTVVTKNRNAKRRTLHEVFKLGTAALIHQNGVFILLSRSDVDDGNLVSFARRLLVEVANLAEEFVVFLQQSHRRPPLPTEEVELVQEQSAKQNVDTGRLRCHAASTSAFRCLRAQNSPRILEGCERSVLRSQITARGAVVL